MNKIAPSIFFPTIWQPKGHTVKQDATDFLRGDGRTFADCPVQVTKQ